MNQNDELLVRTLNLGNSKHSKFENTEIFNYPSSLTFDFEALSSTYWRAAFRREILYFQSKKVIYVRTEEFVIMSSQIMEKQLLLTYFYIFQNY